MSRVVQGYPTSFVVVFKICCVTEVGTNARQLISINALPTPVCVMLTKYTYIITTTLILCCKTNGHRREGLQ